MNCTGGASRITIVINTSSAQPLYQQIVRQVRLQVLQGNLKDGDQLPSIRALARELQVSIITTKRAYEELERDGVLSVSAGRGTFVRAKGMEAGRRTQLDELRDTLRVAAAEARTLGMSEEEFTLLAAHFYREEPV